MIRSSTWVRLVFSLLFVYLFGGGATFTGLLHPVLQFPTLSLLVIMVVVWLVVRWRAGWTWYRTPLDGVMPLWGLAFAVSILTNWDTWRHSAVSLWYMGVYVGVWYILYDLLANRVLKPDALIESILFGGLVAVVAGYMQVFGALSNISLLDLPRPGGTLGNPNSFGTFLIVLMMLSMGLYLRVRDRLGRFVLGMYIAVAFILWVLTFSRGAWFGGAAALGVLTVLLLHVRGMLSPVTLRERWQKLASVHRVTVAGGLVVALIVAGGMTALFIDSLSETGRSASLRTRIYDHALEIIAEKPLTGHGLFSFGRELSWKQSQPPQFPHSHAHNLFLHVQAELGVIGTAALWATLGMLAWGMFRRWRDVQRESLSREQALSVGAIAACAGFGVHHLLDTTIMMPAIMLMGLIAAALAVMPVAPSPVRLRWVALGQRVGLAGLWVMLLGTGFWSVSVYSGYYDALFYALPDEGVPDYRGAAERMQPAIDADPHIAVYRNQQAHLYGMAAFFGDAEALQFAIAGYEWFVQQEPGHAAGWVNLAALYWQDGRRELAFETILRGQALARSSLPIRFQVARYAEALGQDDVARLWYRRALYGDTRLWPEWDETPLSRETLAEHVPSGKAALVLALVNWGEPLSQADAARLWEASGLDAADSTGEAVLRVLWCLQGGMECDIAILLEQAENIADDGREDEAWMRLGYAAVARAVGDTTTARQELDRASALLAYDIGRGDTPFGGNIWTLQFLRLAYPRQFLPQVFFPSGDDALRCLIVRYLAGV